MIIHVLGIPYEVRFGQVPGEDMGMVDYRKQLILVDDQLGPEETAETILHEIIHIVSRSMNIGAEEQAVFRFSKGLYSVITDADNIEFIATLIGGEWDWEDVDTCADCICGNDEELEDCTDWANSRSNLIGERYTETTTYADQELEDLELPITGPVRHIAWNK